MLRPCAAHIPSSTHNHPLLQSRIKECAAVVKGKSFPFVPFLQLLTSCSLAVFEDLPTPRHKRKRVPHEDATSADHPPAAGPFDEHSAMAAQSSAQAPEAAETAAPAAAPLPPASESRADKSSPSRPSTHPISCSLLTTQSHSLSPSPPLRSQACTTRSALQDPDAREAEVGPGCCTPPAHSSLTLFFLPFQIRLFSAFKKSCKK